MDEKKRTKVLAGALGVVLLFGWVKPQSVFLAPLDKANADYTAALLAKESTELEHHSMLKAARNMRLWTKQSLPPNAQNGQRVYIQWLNNLAEESGLSAIEVEPFGRDNKRLRGAKKDVYVAVKATIECEGTLTELSRFMYRFKRTALLHRLKDLTVTSEDIEGDPIMDIKMVAEGVCMANAADRLELFRQTSLTEAIEDDATTLKVADLEPFPSEPGFQLQINTEYLLVTDIDAENKTLTVERARDDTTANPHDENARVQWVPVTEEMKDVTFAQYKDFLAASPFVKLDVKDYEPRIQIISKKTVKPGEKLDFDVKTEGFDPTLGSASYKLAEGHPEGMTIDEKTGAVEWQTADDIERETYKATVLVKQSNNPVVDLSREFSVEVSVPNTAPVLGVPDGRVTAWLGQPLTIDLEVKDETPANRLKFSVVGAEGAYIDSETNAFKWNPDQTLEPGDYTATIKVTDSDGKEAEATLNIVARDDEARYTKLVGSASKIFEGGKQEQEAWMYSTINSKTTKLRVGTKLSVADIIGTVKSIDSRSVTIETAEGQLELAFNTDLRSGAKKVEKVPVTPGETPASESPTEAKSTEAAGE